MSVLLIDAGNTRIKWRYTNQNLTLQGACLHHEVAAQVWPSPIEQVVVASVRSNDALAQHLQQQFNVNIEWLREPYLHHSRFRHCYAQPQRLGVDRWLAMLGAMERTQKACVVVDAGTALTIDVVDSNGRHQGGYIVPGLAMAQAALFQQTERVRPFEDEQIQHHIALGCDTLACVSAGIRRQHLALLQSMAAEYPEHDWLISGGDGEWLASAMERDYYPDLVFEGMESLCVGSFSR
ncbi:MAG: type III pantothenate kinase [Bacterioplanes sp.]|nr:type III pantothenate kinase [Bacterioplanes sp.]